MMGNMASQHRFVYVNLDDFVAELLLKCHLVSIGNYTSWFGCLSRS
jgi:hypothetical protein